jgi:hypothetical protein
VRCAWKIVDPQAGLDVAERIDDGKLRRIIMFHGPLPAD